MLPTTPATSPGLETWVDSMRAALAEGAFDRAESLAREVHTAWRSNALVCLALGELAMYQNDLDRADRELARAAQLAPGLPAAWHDLGAVTQWRQEYDRSIDCLRRALKLAPDARESSIALAHSLFAVGRYDEGWKWFEHRQRGQAEQPRPRGLWDGSTVPHAVLAVFAEEGLGDVVQFCRYIGEIRDRVARVLLVLEPPYDALAPLLASARGVDRVVTDRRRGPPIHAYCPVMTVAHFARASTECPGFAPYLSPPAERMERWRKRLGEGQRFRVGLVWAGNPRGDPKRTAIDARRSIDPALLAPLFSVPDVEWHSLQLGAGLARRDRLPAGIELVDHSEAIGDFADTAALIAQLDFTITVDTSVAHVAGAIGAPVFMFSRFDSCWRWGASGETTPWYPTMRIFRQHAFCDWRGAIDDAAAALARSRR